MSSENIFFGIFLILVGLYFFTRPMKMSVVRGQDWENSPEKAKEKQIWKARYWSVAFIILGVVFILHEMFS